ncbi:guanylin-like [Notolabrus celidotus]|uniref:guanylin-like n=1 Tax=Notolabrus celidotus TaxID=1203425 RepID=UPI00148FA8A3|nr:guanylin-like [Notolabrus celidotus]
MCRGAVGVQVKAGDRIFPLESVKQLKVLMDLDDDNIHLPLPETGVEAACANPLLPRIFRPVCRGRRTGIVFSTLVKSSRPWISVKYVPTPPALGVCTEATIC